MMIRTTLVLVSFLLPSFAFAAELVRSYPAEGDVLEAPLKSLHLWFSEAPLTTSARVKVESLGDSAVPAVEGLHSMGDDDLMAWVRGDMPDGEYRLLWSLQESSGEVRFAVKRPAGYVEDRWEPPLDIGIVLYDGAEPLDVFGPLEMWMNAGPDNIRVHLIAEQAGPVTLTTTSYPRDLAPRVDAPFSFETAPDLDVIMVPGGIGTLVEVDNPRIISFLREAVADVAVATSVCTGSALYAKAGLLEGVEATGNKLFFDYLVAQGPADWKSEARWIESGRFFTSSGVSAGIDMSLAVIERFFGIDAARMIAASAEYVWNENAADDPFVDNLNLAVPWVDQMKEGFEAE
ncbi:MAG: DJ-1/PfpI family protein [Pseudomonadota bacterium]